MQGTVSSTLKGKKPRTNRLPCLLLLRDMLEVPESVLDRLALFVGREEGVRQYQDQLNPLTSKFRGRAGGTR
jgi:hypothetical protein